MGRLQYHAAVVFPLVALMLVVGCGGSSSRGSGTNTSSGATTSTTGGGTRAPLGDNAIDLAFTPATTPFQGMGNSSTEGYAAFRGTGIVEGSARTIDTNPDGAGTLTVEMGAGVLFESENSYHSQFITLRVPHDHAIAVGDRLALDATAQFTYPGASLYEETISIAEGPIAGDGTGRYFNATSGTVEIVARDENGLTLRLEATFRNPYNGETFAASGTLHKAPGEPVATTNGGSTTAAGTTGDV